MGVNLCEKKREILVWRELQSISSPADSLKIFWFFFYQYPSISMLRAVWTKKKSVSLTGIELMTFLTLGRCSIHRATRTHGEQGRFTRNKMQTAATNITHELRTD